MLHGLLGLSFLGHVVALLLLTHITIVSITVFLHRCQAHRSLDLHPAVSHFFRAWLWLTTGMRTKEWVAIHRKHHAKCETKEDPHSPQIKGIRKVLLEGAELYREEAKNLETLARYGHGTPEDWLEQNVYSRYSLTGIGLMLTTDLLLFGIPGLTIWALQMAWIPFFAAGVINGIGHYWGYRNFECPDAARNIVPFGLLIGGEELHNNHHTFPTSAKLSVKWWELDLGWCYIRLLSLLRLAKIKRIPPKLIHEESKKNIDFDTVTALITHRFQILSRYSQEVILPVLQEEKSKASQAGKKLLKNAQILLIRTETLIDEKGKEYIASLLKENNMLALVYHFRLKLQALWERTSLTQRELVETLQEWCKQAENTGISALHTFSNSLASLTNERR